PPPTRSLSRSSQPRQSATSRSSSRPRFLKRSAELMPRISPYGVFPSQSPRRTTNSPSYSTISTTKSRRNSAQRLAFRKCFLRSFQKRQFTSLSSDRHQPDLLLSANTFPKRDQRRMNWICRPTKKSVLPKAGDDIRLLMERLSIYLLPGLGFSRTPNWNPNREQPSITSKTTFELATQSLYRVWAKPLRSSDVT
ncbi:hypothetical protein BGZ89_007819, partial [Linnemannia elongata]